MYAAAAYVTELVGANKLPKTKKEPWWKRRLEGKLKELSRDLDFVNNLLEKRNIKKKNKDRKKIQYSKKETQHYKRSIEATNQDCGCKN